MNISTTKELREAIRNPYLWPGGYASYIVLFDGELLCHTCARTEYKQLSHALRHNLHDGWEPIATIILEELDFCCHCGASIE